MSTLTSDLTEELELGAAGGDGGNARRRVIAPRGGRRRIRSRIGRVLMYAFLVVLLAVVLLPFIWMLSSSFKHDNQVLTVPIQWIPETLDRKSVV